MSIICLICKDKLLNNAPGSSLGSLNSLVENQVIATGCGHLYHFECLQSWFRTQKKKLQNQGVTGNFSDHCPTCQVEVLEDQISRIFLLEDHRDALEKAKFLEKMENLEIYCHQLEIHVQQLQRENDLLINKALAPSNSQLNKDEFSTIVKNDRVVWMKKDSPPLSGIVLSIFKKDGALWVKLKLDKKIRTNSTNQRSGLLGSFRFDKKQDWTVPFEEITLEKDFKRNNIIHENTSLSNPTSPTVVLHHLNMPSFRSSTLSLPGDYMNRYLSGMEGMKPISSFDNFDRAGSNMDLYAHSPVVDSPPVTPTTKSMGPITISDSMSSIATVDSPTIIQNGVFDSHAADHRDYVLLGPPADKVLQQANSKFNEVQFRLPQDTKTKHVTFADDIEIEKLDDIPPVPDRTLLELFGQLKVSVVDDISEDKDETPTHLIKDGIQVPAINLIRPSASPSPTPCSTPIIQTDLQTDVFIDSFEQSLKPQLHSQENQSGFNSSCFDTTFAVLFSGCDVFDKALLLRDSSNDNIQQSVQNILKEEFVTPFRKSQKYNVNYSVHLHEAISHLCSSYLDLEELMTILFEYVFKLPPFISYSYDMCDYIHQFFIDFTDKAKTPSVQQLFERSLSLQDNLKLHGEPSPALILQMPNSEDGIIHYEAVIPSLDLNIESLLEKDAVKSVGQSCYCNKIATLECATCSKIHGKSPVLFCDDCSVLLEAIHDQMYHKLDLAPIKALDIPATTLKLAGVICLNGENYNAFLRNTQEENEKPKWVYIDKFEDGSSEMEELPEFEDWLDTLNSEEMKINKNSLETLQRKLLTECRMFLYLPAQNSFA